MEADAKDCPYILSISCKGKSLVLAFDTEAFPLKYPSTDMTFRQNFVYKLKCGTGLAECKNYKNQSVINNIVKRG